MLAGLRKTLSNRLHIEIYGNGRTIVLLHGWAMHTGIWRSFAQQLAQQARVVCVDLPGHGRSSLHQPFSLASVAAEIIAALDDEPFICLGWSLGALIAIEIAKQAPTKINGLILLAGSPCFLAKPGWAGMEEAVLVDFAERLTISPQVTMMQFMALQVQGLEGIGQLLPALKASVTECPPCHPAVLSAGLQVLKDEDLRPVVAAIDCPVLALFGTRDTIVPVAAATGLQALSSQVQVVVLKKAGHIPFLSHPDATLQAVQDFIST